MRQPPKVLDLPNIVANTGLHGGGDSQSLMDKAEVVPSKVKRQHGVEFLPFLREGVGQASESPHLHSHRQVLALDVGSGVAHQNYFSPRKITLRDALNDVLPARFRGV